MNNCEHILLIFASRTNSYFTFLFSLVPQDDQRLKEMVMEMYPDGKVGKDMSWIDVVNRLGADANGRTAKQVRERWHNSYVFTCYMLVMYRAAADMISFYAVCFYGIISQLMSSLSASFLDRLRPDLKKKGAPWSEKETAALIRLQGELGNSWSKISKRMTCGRSQNDIKNKWNSLMKNQMFLVAYTSRQKEVEVEKNKKNTSKKKAGCARKGASKFAAMMARKLCSRSNYVRDGEDEDLAATSEESDAYDSENDDEEETNSIQVEEHQMTEDGNGHLLWDVEQSESQLEFGRKLEQYKWAVEQEKKIDLFRRGRLDSGLTCSDVESLKLMGLGLGVAALQKKYFGTAPSN